MKRTKTGKKNRTKYLRTVEKNYKGCRICEIEIADRGKKQELKKYFLKMIENFSNLMSDT